MKKKTNKHKKQKNLEILMNKPIYAGIAILDISKITMYDYFYGYLKKSYEDKVSLILHGH